MLKVFVVIFRLLGEFGIAVVRGVILATAYVSGSPLFELDDGARGFSTLEFVLNEDFCVHCKKL